jgi:hypothetical protein
MRNARLCILLAFLIIIVVATNVAALWVKIHFAKWLGWL